MRIFFRGTQSSRRGQRAPYGRLRGAEENQNVPNGTPIFRGSLRFRLPGPRYRLYFSGDFDSPLSITTWLKYRECQGIGSSNGVFDGPLYGPFLERIHVLSKTQRRELATSSIKPRILERRLNIFGGLGNALKTCGAPAAPSFPTAPTDPAWPIGRSEWESARLKGFPQYPSYFGPYQVSDFRTSPNLPI